MLLDEKDEIIRHKFIRIGKKKDKDEQRLVLSDKTPTQPSSAITSSSDDLPTFSSSGARLKPLDNKIEFSNDNTVKPIKSPTPSRVNTKQSVMLTKSSSSTTDHSYAETSTDHTPNPKQFAKNVSMAPTQPTGVTPGGSTHSRKPAMYSSQSHFGPTQPPVVMLDKNGQNSPKTTVPTIAQTKRPVSSFNRTKTAMSDGNGQYPTHKGQARHNKSSLSGKSQNAADIIFNIPDTNIALGAIQDYLPKAAKPISSANKLVQASSTNNNIIKPQPVAMASTISPVTSNWKYPYYNNWGKRDGYEAVTSFGRKLWVSRIIPFELAHNGTKEYPAGNYSIHSSGLVTMATIIS